MERRFVLTIPLQYAPAEFKTRRYRKALKAMAPWVKEVTFPQEGGRPVVKVECESDSVDQGEAFSMIRTELQQHAVELVHKTSDVGEYRLDSRGCSEEL